MHLQSGCFAETQAPHVQPAAFQLCLGVQEANVFKPRLRSPRTCFSPCAAVCPSAAQGPEPWTDPTPPLARASPILPRLPPLRGLPFLLGRCLVRCLTVSPASIH